MDEQRKIIVTTNNLNNSNKARREADKQLPAEPNKRDIKANVKAKVKKESFRSKLKRAFFGDNVENVGDYMFFDVGIPAVKATISDMIGNGIEVLLFGEARGRRRGDRGTDYAHVSRNNRDRRDRDNYDRDRGDNRVISYRDLFFEDKSDAQRFIADIYDYVKDYGRISVSVYMSIGGLTSTSWDDNHKGWYKEDLANLGLIRTRYGWEIDVPRPQRMD